ncbi:MAG: type 2 lanthipeptide synthetase LanM [Minicystis sp.]
MLPPWATSALEFLAGLPESAVAQGAADLFLVAHAALAAPARALLDAGCLAARLPLVSDAVLGGFQVQLVRRLSMASWSLIDLERSLRPGAPTAFGKDAWIRRWINFPTLCFLTGTIVEHWRSAAVELLQRLHADLPILQEQLFGGADPGPLTRIDGDCGDLHCGGRAVAVLTFESGARAVYKPKDLRCAREVNELISILNAGGLSTPLRERAILCRGPYTWEEHVSESQSTSPADAARFFRRFGMTLRILQLVEARDCWIDNLKVVSDAPVFIDMECILEPRLRVRGAPSPSLAEDLFQESVIPTGAVTLPQGLTQRSAWDDFGALAGPGLRRLPLSFSASTVDRVDGSFEMKNGELLWEIGGGWPLLDGAPARALDFIDELTAGFHEVQSALRAQSSELLAPGGFVDRLSQCPVRSIVRTTWSYLALSRRSVSPAALVDCASREIELAAVLGSVAGPGGPFPLDVAAAELGSLRVMDVPLFHSIPSRDSLSIDGDREVKGCFIPSAAIHLRRRLKDIDRFDERRHLQILRASVSLMARSPARPVDPAPLLAEEPFPDCRPWAAAIGDELLSAALGDGARLSFIGIQRHLDLDLATVNPASRDLVDGTLGPAIFFAELAAATGMGRYAEATIRLLSRQERELALSPSLGVGAAAGAGALVHALARSADRLKDDTLFDAAFEIVNRVSRWDLTSTSSDFARGKTGLLCAVRKLLQLSRRDDVAARRLAIDLAATDDLSPALPARPPLDLLPAAPFARALAETTSGGSPDLPRAPASIGDLTAVIHRLRLAGAAVPPSIVAGVWSHLRAPRFDHGRSAALADLALEAFSAGCGPDFLSAARAIAAAAIEHRVVGGTWFGDPNCPDTYRLSILDGLPALGMLFLRLGDSTLNSVRILG